MDIFEFSKQKKQISSRIETLQNQIGLTSDTNSELLEQSLEELQVAMEELQVAEEELHQQNEELLAAHIVIETERLRYQELFEFASEGYLVTDAYGAIREANKKAADLLGVSPSKLRGKPLISFIELEARSIFRKNLLHALQLDSEYDWEIKIQPRQGYAFDSALKVAVVRQEEGEPTALRWIVRDITPQKEAEAQLQALNTQLMQRNVADEALRQIGDRLRDNLDEAHILQTTLQELTLALNLKACDIGLYDLSAQTSTVHGAFTQIPVSPSNRGVVAMQSFPEGYRQLLQCQTFQFCELNNPIRGEVSILACPIVDHQEVLGDIWCFSAKEQALTPSEVYLIQQVAKQCATALRQARLYKESQNQVEQLKKLNWLKNDFLSTISHELRTPLTNMKMALYVIDIAKFDEQRERCLHILREECDREANLITDLLDLQYLEAGAYPELALDSLDVRAWLPKFVEPLKAAFTTSQQPFSIQLSRKLPRLLTVRQKLERILQELLKNANKHTPFGGEIKLTVERDVESDRLLIIVQNQAEIPTEELPYVFEKFYRTPNFNPSFIDGTGLGLPLTKRLVEYLQGTITLTSGQGWTKATVSLPLHLRHKS
ncbi:ATP-binding protein [Leptolyngbya sp. FACHB-8]|uniref:sensor histidine kinase n=1 Tax=unclassified Leptolyngbya TaxID=2650499 RepID=UPI001687EAD0|nr:ATP-binding protein [Leptolyngbya sp. FACHB-8]MBD1912851.1 PAS domain S-box protein [Leptolyngbya sp. FACHB-8]